MHHPDTVAARHAKSEARWEEQRKQQSWYKLQQAEKRIVELDAATGLPEIIPTAGQCKNLWCIRRASRRCRGQSGTSATTTASPACKKIIPAVDTRIPRKIKPVLRIIFIFIKKYCLLTYAIPITYGNSEKILKKY